MRQGKKPQKVKELTLARIIRAAGRAGMRVGRFDVDPQTGRVSIFSKDEGTAPDAGDSQGDNPWHKEIKKLTTTEAP